MIGDILCQNINVTIKKLLNLLFSFCFPNVVISNLNVHTLRPFGAFPNKLLSAVFNADP